jgi:hypothetical protein
MIKKKILNDKRIRRISGGFSFIPHRFLTDGFFTALDQHQLLLYFFLVLVSDRYGLSYYAYDSICTALRLSLEQYIDARNSLIKKDLIAFDGTIFQVLSLPAPLNAYRRQKPRSTRGKGPVSVAQVFQQSLKGLTHDR